MFQRLFSFRQKPFLPVFFIGLLLLLNSIILDSFSPKAATKLLEVFSRPIIAFEFVESESEVYEIFGKEDTAERQAFIAAIDRTNYVDFPFMLIYSAFLFCFCGTVARLTGQSLYYLGGGLAVLALIGDAVENWQLLAITDVLNKGGFQSYIHTLIIFTWLKWGALALIFGLLTPYFLTRNWGSKVLGLIAFTIFITGGVSIFDRSIITEVFTQLIGLGFIGIWIYSFLYKNGNPELKGN